MDGRHVDEPFGQPAGALRLPDRGQEPGVPDETDLQLLRGAAGAIEVLQEPFDFGHDAPCPIRRLTGRQGSEPAQFQAAVFEERLAQVPFAARGDEEDPSCIQSEEGQQSGADDGKRMDPGHLVPVKHLQPGPDPIRADDGREQDAVVPPTFGHPSLPAGPDIGRAGKQSSAPAREDRPPAAAEHVGSRLALEVLLDHVDEEEDGWRGGAYENLPEPGVSRLVRREVHGPSERAA